MATLLTNYDIVGAKEDVSDIISLISPTETPFTSSIGKESVHNTLFSWQEDALATPNLNNRARPRCDVHGSRPPADRQALEQHADHDQGDQRGGHDRRDLQVRPRQGDGLPA